MLLLDWTKERGNSILLIPWASELPPVEIIENFRKFGCGYFPEDLELLMAPSKVDIENEATVFEQFLCHLRDCSSVFFAGGDQNRLDHEV